MNARNGVWTMLAALCMASAPAAAQGPVGQITGRVVDAQSGRGVTGARVAVQGTTLAAAAGVDGRYTLRSVPAGPHAITVSMLGYGAKTVTGVNVTAGAAATADVSLSAAAIGIGPISVSATRERGSVGAALDAQRTATGVVNSVTAEQIAKSPDVNAAQAVQRVSGVTVQDGKYVVVRGLGERYTTTSLNGARLPSPETDRKVVPLDLFPASLLQTVATSKTFTPDQTGDFSGAQVDIRTREYPSRRVVTVTTSGGFNDAATGRSLVGAPTAGGEWLGLAGTSRALPQAVRDGGDFRNVPQVVNNRAVRSFRDSWTPRGSTGAPNGTFGLTVGGSDPIFGHTLGYVFSGSYNRSQEVRRNEHRALAVGEPTQALNVFDGETGRVGVLWGGVANLSTQIGGGTRIAFNNVYNRSADNEAHQDHDGSLYGYDFPVRRSWLSYVERSVRSNQLRGEHALGGRQAFSWQLTSSGVTRSEPDRTDLLYVSDAQGRYALETFTGSGVRRSFSDLGERSLSEGADYKLDLGPSGSRTQLKVGGLFRQTRRDVDLRTFGIQAFGLTEQQAMMGPEQLFGGALAADDSAHFYVNDSSAGGRYAARDHVGAGYAMLDHPFGERVRVVAGARVESWNLDIAARRVNAPSDTTYTYRSTDVLPSLAVNVKLRDTQNLRFSVSQTLSRPEYRELVPFLQTNPVGDVDFFGNASLKRALIRNFDTRWESYPRSGEVITVGVFAKQFIRPIEQIQVASTGGSILSFVNTDRAVNYGVELEARRDLDFLAERLSSFSAFANATLMKSEIQVGNDSISALTNSKRPMVGQSPYVVNAGLSYGSASGATSATLLYNVVGRRIVSTGVKPVPDTYQQARNVLDLSLQQRVGRGMTAKLNARNLLDAPYRETAGSVTRLEYRTGRIYSIGLTWTPSGQ
ncbi:MAG TPA: TonB-dependent receptor [Longimicrobiaceae bacterium]|jgi:outer membrane receptor protein involved in Fe transport|nr:TonB-dependent receptor [Longimicrobiaceae bacterium]